MGKTLNEMTTDLKAYIKDLNSDATNIRSFHAEKYNNMKFTMDPAKDSKPHIVISIAISEAKYNLNTFEKMNGSLGPDEKYVQRWFGKSGVADSLKECWKTALSGKNKQEQEQDDKAN